MELKHRGEWRKSDRGLKWVGADAEETPEKNPYQAGNERSSGHAAWLRPPKSLWCTEGFATQSTRVPGRQRCQVARVSTARKRQAVCSASRRQSALGSACVHQAHEACAVGTTGSTTWVGDHRTRRGRGGVAVAARNGRALVSTGRLPGLRQPSERTVLKRSGNTCCKKRRMHSSAVTGQQVS